MKFISKSVLKQYKKTRDILLREFPDVFGTKTDPLPLHKSVRSLLLRADLGPGVATAHELDTFLQIWTMRREYKHQITSSDGRCTVPPEQLLCASSNVMYQQMRSCLADRFPEIFRGDAKPKLLKVGIYKDLMAHPAIPEYLKHHALDHFLEKWVNHPRYALAILHSRNRFDLEMREHDASHELPNLAQNARINLKRFALAHNLEAHSVKGWLTTHARHPMRREAYLGALVRLAEKEGWQQVVGRTAEEMEAMYGIPAENWLEFCAFVELMNEAWEMQADAKRENRRRRRAARTLRDFAEAHSAE